MPARSISPVDGQDHRRIGYIFQQDALLPWRTVEANVMLAAELSHDLSKESAEQLVRQYLQTFNLNENILKQHPAALIGWYAPAGKYYSIADV